MKTYFDLKNDLQEKSEDEFDKACKEAEKATRRNGGHVFLYFDGKKLIQSKDPIDDIQCCATIANGEVHVISRPKKLDEALTIKGRRSLARAAKRRKAKLSLDRKKAKRRTAPQDRILKRAQRRARRNVAKHIMPNYKTLGHNAKNRLQQMVNARSGQLDVLRLRLVPQVRKDDRRK